MELPRLWRHCRPASRRRVQCLLGFDAARDKVNPIPLLISSSADAVVDLRVCVDGTGQTPQAAMMASPSVVNYK
jgi:hypothetical protein